MKNKTISILGAWLGAGIALPLFAATLADDAFDWYDARELQFEGQAKWANLYIIHSEEMFPDDGEATIDHCHPNDWGMMHMGRAYAAKIKEILAK